MPFGVAAACCDGGASGSTSGSFALVGVLSAPLGCGAVGVELIGCDEASGFTGGSISSR